MKFIAENLLRALIRSIIKEEVQNPRIATQLIDVDDAEKNDDSIEAKEKARSTESDSLDEFSGVGAIAGMTLPLGMSPNDKKRKK